MVFVNLIINNFKSDGYIIMSNKFLLDIPKTFLLTAYTFICGFTYICGFWYNFKIDLQIVFSLLSPLDIIKSFIIPISSAIGIVILQLLMNFVSNYGYSKADDLMKQIENIYLTEEPKPQEQKKRKLSNVITSQFGFVALLSVGITVLIIYKIITTEERMYFNVFIIFAAGIFVLTVFIIFCVDSGFEKAERYFVIAFSICILPAIIYFIGGYTGKNAIEDEKAMIMMDNNACSSDPKEQYVLLSLYGSKGISASLKDHSICLFEAEKTSFKSRMPTLPQLLSE